MNAKSPAAIENNRRLSREAKRRRKGRCVECGATTAYNGSSKNGGVSERCVLCASRKNALAMRGKGPVVQRMLAAYANGPMRNKDVAVLVGISQDNVGYRVDRLRKYGLLVRVARGVHALPSLDSDRAIG